MLADDSSGTAVLNCGLNTKNITAVGAIADHSLSGIFTPNRSDDTSGMSGFCCIEAYRAFCMDGGADVGLVVTVDNKGGIAGCGIGKRFIAIDTTADAANNVHLFAVNVVDGDVSGHGKVLDLYPSGATADEADVAAGVGNAVVGDSVVVAFDYSGKISVASERDNGVVSAVDVVHDFEGACAEFIPVAIA